LNDRSDPPLIMFQLFYKTDFYLEHVGSVFIEKLYYEQKQECVFGAQW
jgi:hypothetical protein